MKLVPLLLLFGSFCLAEKKIKKIRRLLVAIGGIASLASKGGSSSSGGIIGKSLQLLTRQSASTGQQYAFIAQPLVISISPVITPATYNTLQPPTFTAVVNQQAVPVSSRDGYIPVQKTVGFPIDTPYTVPLPVVQTVPVDGSAPVASSSLLDQTPLLHQITVGLGLAQSPALQVPLGLTEWAV